ncbi:FtsQ-type POTRA domain-containing protein [Treponema parvum]|uniref:FtsQ-type POTRA domain-containing protein n=1 Tax=Treponema parvum TaxID=138851 RepID=A0A975F3L2_9SPIR|nr:FtsQ-type POTRA domain-containing protein [Treponema parvum]QTQ13727.1 FtsQ-type POTRA domain-containing protein [Treponema parvum]
MSDVRFASFAAPGAKRQSFGSLSYAHKDAIRDEDKISPEKAADKKHISALKIIFIILCFCLLLEGLAYKVVLPLMRYPAIEFSGIKNYSEQELTAVIYSGQKSSWLNFDTGRAAAALSSLSAVESVSVSKHFPDTISVTVTERSPVALTFITMDGRSVPVQIDKNGVLFSPNAESPVSDRTIPIVSGLPVEHLTDGMRIPQKYRRLIDQISDIRKLSQKYFAAISEICVVPKEYGNYELVLYPVGSRTRVLTDRSLSEEALQYMMVVLDIVKSLDSGVSEIDLRYGSVSYRTDGRWRRP